MNYNRKQARKVARQRKQASRVTRTRLEKAAPDLYKACEVGLSYVKAIISKVPRPILDLDKDKKQMEAALSKARPKE